MSRWDWESTTSGAFWIALAAPALLAERVVTWTYSFGDTAATYPPLWSMAGLAAYVATPLVVIPSFLLFLLPGLVLCRERAGGDVFRWILQAFAVSLLVTVAASQALTAVGLVAAGWPFALSLLIVTIAAAAVVGPLARGRGSADRDPAEASADGPGAGSHPVASVDPLADAAARPFLVTSTIALVALTILLAPKIHWEHFNGDGAHAFESARALMRRVTPFWPAEAGDIAAFPGVTSFLFALPGVVFLRIMGPVEAAARLPALLYLLPLAAGILGVVRRAGAGVGAFQIRFTWLGLALFTIVLGFSATYNAYTADLALPATQDTLLMATFVGFLVAFLDRSPGWIMLFGVLTCVGLPSGTLLILLWCAAAVFALRPLPWRAIGWSVAALTAAGLLGVLGPLGLEALGAPVPGDEYAGASLMERLRDPVLLDLRRFLFWVVPCGIAPAIVFLRFRGHSPVGKAAMAVTLAYFAFFYVQPKTALHYYVPAMVLPWIVLWSHRDLAPVSEGGAPARGPGYALMVALLIAAGVSIPWGYRLDRSAWLVGATVSERIGGYERSDPEVFRASDLLAEVVPLDWDGSVPEESFGGSPLVWLRYADRGAAGLDAPVQLLPAAAPAPPGGRLLASHATAALWVIDEVAWRRLREIRPPAKAGAPIYRIPKATLF